MFLDFTMDVSIMTLVTIDAMMCILPVLILREVISLRYFNVYTLVMRILHDDFSRLVTNSELNLFPMLTTESHHQHD